MKGSKNKRPLIWFKWRDSTCTTDSSDIDQFGNYFVSRQHKVKEFFERWDAVAGRIKELNIPTALVNDLIRGTKRLRLRLRDFLGVYTRGIRNDTEIVFFGENRNELYWPADKLADFLRVIFMLHYFH